MIEQATKPVRLSPGYGLQGDYVTEVPYRSELELYGYFEPYSGYGNETISLAKALAPMFPAASARQALPPLPLEVTMMFTRDASQVKDSIIFTPPWDIQLSVLATRHSKLHVITMWETNKAPEEWREFFKPITDVFCPCPASVEVFQELLPDKQVRLLSFGWQERSPGLSTRWRLSRRSRMPLVIGMTCILSCLIRNSALTSSNTRLRTH